MADKESDLLKGLFIGGLIGMVLGVLFAPKSGKETREEITRKANNFLTKAKEEYEKAAEKSKLAYEESLKYLKDLNVSVKEKADKVSGLAHQGVETLQSNKNRFKKAIDAGLEAYREEKNKEKD
ncbi:MAG: YtxH domain-containing protein [Syntrophaceae bacterium]|nr:YtxH domain-containing protein [Syntrophaceae bacterium]